MQRSRGILFKLDWITVAIYLLLISMGWLAIYAAEFDGLKSGIFDFGTSHGKQVIWIGVSLVMAGLILVVDSKFYITFGYIIYFLVLLSLVAVLLFGATIKGSKSWFMIGGFGIQPAEFAKFATALALAKFLSAMNVQMRSFQTRVIAGAITMIPAALILLQGDTGSALVYFSFVLVLYREGLPSGFLLTGLVLAVISVLALLFNQFMLIAVLAAIAAVLLYFARKNTRAIAILVLGLVLASGYVLTVSYIFNNVLRPHQQQRVNVLLGKEQDLMGAGYNVNQSKIAIGSGGFSGKGYLNGTQTKFNFVPEQSTDFIFCTVGEEFGFIGSFVMLGLFLFLLLRIIFIAERQRSKFTRLYGYGVASILFFHAMVNIGMTIGLAPVIGIPFPFFSYGGSSIISFTILLFILLKLDGDRLSVLR